LTNFNIEKYPKVQFSIITNGLLLTADVWKEIKHLKNNISSIQVSIDAATPETYKVLRRGGDFLYLLKNLKMLSRLRKDGELKSLGVSFVVQESNYKEMPAFVKMGLNLGVDNIYFMRIANWDTFTEEEFRDHCIWDKEHPEHDDFKELLKDSSFNHPNVNLGNVYEFTDER